MILKDNRANVFSGKFQASRQRRSRMKVLPILPGRRSLLLGWIVVVSAVFGNAQSARPQSEASGSNAPGSPQRAFLKQYCEGCHNERAKTAGLTLDKMDLTRVNDNGEVWEKVV